MPRVMLMNTAQYPMPDPEANIVFLPATPTLAEYSDWAKKQECIVLCADQTGADPAPMVPPKK